MIAIYVSLGDQILIVNLLINRKLNSIINQMSLLFDILWWVIYALTNVAVLNYDSKIINSHRTLPSKLKYFCFDPTPNYSHEDVFC